MKTLFISTWRGQASMSGKQIVICTAANLPQAHLLRNVLEELGIPASITNDAVQFAVGEAPAGWATAPRVVVDEQQAELARRVALEFEAAGRSSRLRDEIADETDSSAGRETVAWPVCPKCGRRRTAICPFCGSTGDDTPPADLSYQATEEHAGDEAATAELLPGRPSIGARRNWLLCPTCEEPFEAQYECACAKCGHDFGDGIKRPDAPPALLFSPPRLAWLSVGIAATALLMLWKPVMGCLLVAVIIVATLVRRSIDSTRSL
jgi:Putative prokaryotic signal transducing protein